VTTARAGGGVDPAIEAALAKLADVMVPQPPSLLPQTWGWLVLAVVALVLAGWQIVRVRRRRAANRYRVEALAQLARLEAQLGADARSRAAALREVPPLLKRVALAAWPRERVASLSGPEWLAFLRSGGAGIDLGSVLPRLLDDGEYRAAPASLSAAEASDLLRAVRAWIEDHRVSA